MSKKISDPEIFTAEVAAGGPSIDWTRKIFFFEKSYIANNLKDLDGTWSEVRQNEYKADAND